MIRFRLALAAALALAIGAAPAQAQRAASVHQDGALYCEIHGVVLRKETAGHYTINFMLEMPGDIATARIAVPGLLSRLAPRLLLFYSGKFDRAGKAAGSIGVFAVTGIIGEYSHSRPFPRENMNLVIESGTMRTPPLILPPFDGGNRDISGSAVNPGSGMDALDTELGPGEIDSLADFVLTQGATMRLFENGREVATVNVPLGSVGETQQRALAWVDRALPFLREGKCPN